MSVWSVVWRVVDTLLGVAIKADELAERRRARRRLELLGDAMARDAEKRARATAKTVVLPRPEPATSRPPAAGGAPPTAPTRPGRGR